MPTHNRYQHQLEQHSTHRLDITTASSSVQLGLERVSWSWTGHWTNCLHLTWTQTTIRHQCVLLWIQRTVYSTSRLKSHRTRQKTLYNNDQTTSSTLIVLPNLVWYLDNIYKHSWQLIGGSFGSISSRFISSAVDRTLSDRDERLLAMVLVHSTDEIRGESVNRSSDRIFYTFVVI